MRTSGIGDICAQRRRTQSSEGRADQTHRHQNTDSDLLLSRELKLPHNNHWKNGACEIG